LFSVALLGRKMWLKTDKTGFVDQPIMVPASELDTVSGKGLVDT